MLENFTELFAPECLVEPSKHVPHALLDMRFQPLDALHVPQHLHWPQTHVQVQVRLAVLLAVHVDVHDGHQRASLVALAEVVEGVMPWRRRLLRGRQIVGIHVGRVFALRRFRVPNHEAPIESCNE